MPYTDPEKKLAANRAYSKKHYQSHKEEARQKKARQRERMKQLIREQKDIPCTDCGERYPDYIMEFDHLEPAVKGQRPCDLISLGSPRRILEEIAKCEVVCANCHAIRTWKRRHNMDV